jgi:hypothetical protein
MKCVVICLKFILAGISTYMMTKKCEVCNKEFSGRLSVIGRRRTCSKSCGGIIRRTNYKERKCLSCGESFSSYDGKYCSSKCCGEHKKLRHYQRDIALFEKGELKRRNRIKPLLIERDGYICSVCKNTTWLKKPITLWTDHIDGNASNNNTDNLRLVCPNCDSQSETFMAKNKGNGRKSRGMKPWE